MIRPSASRIFAVAIALVMAFATPVAIMGADSSYPNVYLRQFGTGQPALVIQSAAGPGIVSDNGSVVFNQRFRTTIANVNTGVTLLAAIPGYKYRVVDMTMISVGGATATCTTVDVLATQSAGGVKLLAVAVAALTQSAVVRAGDSNATVLADGASFVQNDVNTAVTIGKTGSSCATATHIDLILTYAIES